MDKPEDLQDFLMILIYKLSYLWEAHFFSDLLLDLLRSTSQSVDTASRSVASTSFYGIQG